MSATSGWSPIVNSVTGDQMLVLTRGSDSEGPLLEVQFDLPPHSPGTPMHRHRRITERFDVLDGALSMCVNGVWRVVTAGASALVVPGDAHCYRNDSDAWVTFITELRPPHRFERFLRTWYGLANTGMSSRDGVPRNLLHLARCLHDADFTFAVLPSLPQRIALSALVRAGTMLGAYAALMDFDVSPVPPDMAISQ
jgi:quercetin dioxygenase-like cupin family protein